MRLTAKELEQMKSVDIGAVAPESLPDVSGMAFDTSLPREERIALFLQAVENPYCFCEKISVQLDEIKRKIEDAENSKKLLEQNELSDKIKLKDFLEIQKFDTEKLREIIKVIRVHSQDEIEIEWNFDDIFSEQR